MNVLHVLDHSAPLLSGYSSRSRSLILTERAHGLRPVVLTSPKQGPTRSPVDDHDGIRHYRTSPARGERLDRLPLARELSLMARLTRRIAHVVDTEAIRVLHSHSPVLNGYPALWVARRRGLPVFYQARAFWEDAAVDHGHCTEESFRYRFSRALETRLFHRVDRVFTICEGMRQEIVARGVRAERVTVVPNGVDTEWFRPRPTAPDALARLGLAPGGLVLGYVGSFYRYEGLRFLLETVPALRRELPGLQVLLVGGGMEEAALRALAAPLGDAVRFGGAVPHERIREVYSVIDVIVCPRRRVRLTELVTPLKPLEAMAMAKPVLASDVGGLRELILHGRTGVLFEAGSSEAFVDAARRLGQAPELREQLGRAARASVVGERGWDGIVSRYVPLYLAAG